jgi:hypothetical protein
MGSLICVKDDPDPVPGDELIYEVVDGQQRLTTLSLLWMALHANLTDALAAYTSLLAAMRFHVFLTLTDPQLR